MTTYRAIAATEYAPDAPVTSEWGEATAINPTAIAEGATGSPVILANWHPYNSTFAGETDGLIYDSAVDGTVASIISPNMVDGYQYKFAFLDLTGTENTETLVDLFQEVTETYVGNIKIAGAEFGGIIAAYFSIEAPRIAARTHFVTVRGIMSSGTFDVAFGSVQKALRVRVTRLFGNISGGRLYMLRRKLALP